MTPNNYKKFWVLSLISICIVSGSGCSTRLERMRERLGLVDDPRLDNVIRENLEATGGLEAWIRTVSIEAQAVATVFESGGGQTFVHQYHTVEPLFPEGAFALTLISNEPEGRLVERLDHEGQVTISREAGDGIYYESDMEELYGAALKLLLEGQSLTQTASLLREDVSVSYLQLERKGGRPNHKIALSGRLVRHVAEGKKKEDRPGRVDDTLVVWINEETHLIERMWLRYQRPNQPDKFGFLAVNVSEYQATPDGLTLPRRLEFVPSDEYQQFSRRLFLVVEFQEIGVVMEIPK
ncbi:MAG: hypothetical protein JW860_01005 [Sedimentisphaerales bacterium]|nr:hypothetical protein [Sedimentisphaerales bacterium]